MLKFDFKIYEKIPIDSVVVNLKSKKRSFLKVFKIRRYNND